MDPLNLSVIGGDDEVDIVQQLGVKSEITPLSWESYWREVVNFAIYAHGADVSQVAASATGALMAMNVLHTFNSSEIASLGGTDAFLTPCWESTHIRDLPGIWAIPYWSDVYVVFYWRDMLAQAGIDERGAFETADQFEETLKCLQTAGFQYPWAIDVASPYRTLNSVVSWIWGAGGEIIRFDGEKLNLLGATAMECIRTFFKLKQYMLQDIYQPADDLHAERLFFDRKVAVTLSNPSSLALFQQKLIKSKLGGELGVALPPGPAFVGGTNLVVWKHSRQEKEALELVRHLTSKKFQIEYCKQSGFMPTRFDTLSDPYFSSDPNMKVMVEALKTGRTYPALRRWGLIEERLSSAFQAIWFELFQQGATDLDGLMEKHLGSLKARLELALNT